MCLILIAFQPGTDQPLVVAGNRDEFHSRPTQKADWWPDQPDLLGGRDLQAGGTWLAINRSGRFAAVTNYRDAATSKVGKQSRGHLVTRFLQAETTPVEFVSTVAGDDYAGFNLLVSDGRTLAYLSNRSSTSGELAPGIYGLSNATLDTPWEKVERSKRKLNELTTSKAVNETSLMRLLADREKGPTEEAKAEHLPFATAHAITAPFIVLPEYGTRCSTVVIADQGGQWQFAERRFAADGSRSGESRYSFERTDR
ncbi:MAG: NRDE family protein [Woeseiaceae bacterium]